MPGASECQRAPGESLHAAPTGWRQVNSAPAVRAEAASGCEVGRRGAPVIYPRWMRWAAAIACVVVCAACTAPRGRAPVPTSSPDRPSAMRTQQSTRPAAPQPAVANDPAAVPTVADDPSTLARQPVAAGQTVPAPGPNEVR